MKNISLVKIFIALLICSIYLFTCVVIGIVPDNKPTETSNPALPDDSGANGEGTTDFLPTDGDNQTEQPGGLPENLFTLSFEAPKLAQKPFSSEYKPSDRIKELLTEKPPESSSSSVSSSSTPQSSSSSSSKPHSSSSSSSRPHSSSSSTSKTQSSSSSSSRPQSSSSSSSKTQSSSSSISTPQNSSHASSEPQSSSISSGAEILPPDDPDNSGAANEILTVRNSRNNGEVVSGKAVDIISQIVQNEIGGTFAPEAIKAQAVAAYTHVKYNNMNGNNPNVALRENVSSSVRLLVNDVIGEAVYYNGEIIQAVYSASSAGYTASSGSVWGVPLPYLQSVYCELDEQYDPNYGKTKTFSSADIKSRVYNTTGITLDGDPSGWIEILSYSEGKYVGDMALSGHESYVNSSGKSVKITGRVFRETIMSYDIRSIAFDVDYDAASDTFTFTTYGYGHGVGLSQNGANLLATHWAWDYKQILEFYYQGTVVK